MRDAIWPNGGIAHLLRHTRPAVGVGARIHPALDVFCNKSTVGASTELDANGCRMTVECEPLLVSIQHDLDWTADLTRQAGSNCLVADKRFGTECSTHRRTNDANPVFWYTEDTGKVHAKVERSLGGGPDLKAISPPESNTGMGVHMGLLSACRPACLLNNYLCLI